MAIAGVIGAVVKWVNGNDDKVRLEANRDNRMLKKQVEHPLYNNKVSFEAVKNKLDHHSTEITRLTSDQRSMDRAITDMREANHATHKLIEQRIDAVCTMIKEYRETHKEIPANWASSTGHAWTRWSNQSGISGPHPRRPDYSSLSSFEAGPTPYRFSTRLGADLDAPPAPRIARTAM